MNFNFNEVATAELHAYTPLDPKNFVIDTALQTWAPNAKKRLPSIRGKLLQDNGREHAAILKIVDDFDKNFLF